MGMIQPVCRSGGRRACRKRSRRISGLVCWRRSPLGFRAARRRCGSPFARRTERLDVIVHHCGLALGGRPAARLARRLMLPVGRDTLLRTVRRRTGVPAAQGLRRVGIDDWAWRKGMSYGTLVCDLDRRRIVDLLPDREPGSVAAWLASHPGLRSSHAIEEAATRGLPRRRSRWRTAGTLWRTPARRFSPPCAGP